MTWLAYLPADILGITTVTLVKLAVFGTSTTGNIEFPGEDGFIDELERGTIRFLDGEGSIDELEGGYIDHLDTGLVEV